MKYLYSIRPLNDQSHDPGTPGNFELAGNAKLSGTLNFLLELKGKLTSAALIVHAELCIKKLTLSLFLIKTPGKPYP